MAIFVAQVGYDVSHLGRDKYIATKKRDKHSTYIQSKVELSIDVLTSGERDLAEAYLCKLSTDSGSPSDVWSYLLYRFLHRLQKEGFDYPNYLAGTKLLFDHGVKLSYKVTKRRNILAWAVISQYWELARCFLQFASTEVLRELNEEGIVTEVFDGKNLESSHGSLFETIEETAPGDILSVFRQNGSGRTTECAKSSADDVEGNEGQCLQKRLHIPETTSSNGIG